MKIFEDKAERLDLALSEEESLTRLHGSLTALGNAKGLPSRVFERYIDEGEKDGQRRQHGLVERRQLSADLFADPPCVIPSIHVEVRPEQVDERQVRGRRAVGDQSGFQNEPALRAKGMRELPGEARFPDARLSDDRHNLTATGAGLIQRALELLNFCSPPNETGQAPRGGHLEPRPRGPNALEFVDLQRHVQPPDDRDS